MPLIGMREKNIMCFPSRGWWVYSEKENEEIVTVRF